MDLISLSLRRPSLLVDARTRARSSPGRGRHAAGVGQDGSDVEDDLSGATSRDDYDRVFRRYLKRGWVPDYVAKAGWWAGKVRITGGGHVLDLLVLPDYGAVGTDDDPFRVGNESQSFAQEYVDAFDSVMPSQKLLRDIEAASNPRIPYIPVQTKSGGEDASLAGLVRANTLAQEAVDKRGIELGKRLIIGYRKAYVVRPNLDGRYIAIYGGRYAGGGLVQPPSGQRHGSYYSGPSHGIVAVSRKAVLDGERVDLRDDVFGSDDPSVVALVSDEGRFDPVWPNAGAGSLAKFSAGGGGGGGGGGSGGGGGGGGGTTVRPPRAAPGPSEGGVGLGTFALGAAAIGLVAWGLS